MYNIAYTTQFKKGYKLSLKRGCQEDLIQSVIIVLVNKRTLAAKHKPHKLSGTYKDCWECHILPDWLLIWRADEATNTLTLIATGTHADLF
ncbi:MAG: type II toxin-antitoxin system YafQ family toxin [Bacteroidota bacterium]